jgi:ribosomal protein L37E
MAADDPTFTLSAQDGHPFIQCELCGLRSFHPTDIAQQYCGRCHLFHQQVRDARKLHADGFTHECHEWPTAKDVCAVCGAPSPWLAGR